MLPILVVFHMTGCPHCPPVLRAASGVQGAHVLAVESDHALCPLLQVKSYPTVVAVLPSGAFERAPSGDRSTSDLQAWLDSKA